MAHPGLESADINAMAQVLSGKRVPEFMQKEMPAVWPLRAAISVAGEALSAVEFRSFGGAFYDHVVFRIRIALGIGKNQLRRKPLAALSQSSQLIDEGGGQGHGPLLPVLWLKPPNRFFDDSDDAVMKIQITPGDMLSFAVAEPGAQQKLQEDCLVHIGVPEERLDLLRLIDWSDLLNVVGPIVRLDQFRFAVALEHLQDDDQFVIHGAPTQSAFVTVRHEFQY